MGRITSLWILIAVFHSLHTPASSLQNIAINKDTKAQRDSGGPLAYQKYGVKENLVDGSKSAVFTGTDCSGCFGSIPYPGFWQVDLGQKFFVAYVKIFGILGFNYNITGLSIVVSEQEGGEDQKINFSYDPNNFEKQYTLEHIKYVQYVRIITTTEGMMFDEVEVFGFTNQEFLPRQFEMDDINTSSVKLKWRRPLNSVGFITLYQYRCGVGTWIDKPSEDLDIEQVVSGLRPSRYQTCQVKVKHSQQDPLTDTSHTWCGGDARPTPDEILFGVPVRTLDDERRRWRYTITWTMPSDYKLDCLDTNSPYKLQVDSTDITNHGGNSYQYYADGHQSAVIKVWSRNRQNFLSANPLEKSITTQTGLPPQLSPRNAGLSSPSYDCVVMAYDTVQYPNGPPAQIIYQYKCTLMTSWQNMPSNRKKCGYTGYQMVECELRARNNQNSNSNKDSDTASASTRTRCPNPDEVRDIDIRRASVINSNRLRWKYTITWQDPSNIKCASIQTTNPYQIHGSGLTAWTNLQTNSYEFYTDGYVDISLHVKVFNNEGLGSLEKDITFTTSSEIAPQVRPRNVALTAPVHYCVEMSYTDVEYPNAPTSQIIYQYKCTSMSDWQAIPSNKRKCNYSAYELVTCQIRAHNNNNNMNSETATTDSIYTKCRSPNKVENIQENRSNSPEMNSNRLRWRYTVTWQNPNIIRCARIRTTNPYQITGYGLTAWTNLQTNSYEFYTDGNVEISLRIKVYNNENIGSAVHEINFTTTSFYPQTKPQNFVSTPTSASCVRLSWDPPAHLNSPAATVFYQHNCNTLGWETVTNNSTVCRFSPYTEVTCLLKAKNSYGDSSSETASSTTLCSDPSSPRDITFTDQGTALDSNRVRRKYSVSWTEPNVINCRSLRPTNKYAFKDPSGNWYNTNDNNYIIFTEGNEEITVGVTVTNNQNFVSTETPATYITHSFRPQTAPRVVRLFSSSPACVTMTWTPPEFPNGLLEYYQYKCTDDNDWVTFNGNAAARSGNRCDYNPYSQVSCKVRARNNQGWSDEASVGSIRTLCDIPTKPQDIQITYKDEGNDGGRRRLRYRISWQNPTDHNCIRLRTTNTFRVFSSNSNGYVFRAQKFFDVYADGVTNVTAAVESFNNHNNRSLPETKEIITQPMRPQTSPRAFSVFSNTFNCVTLTWIAPQYPNGYISHYQFKCTGNETWTNVSRTSFDLDHCLYDAHTEVECRIKATNQVGDSEVAVENTKTLCTYPVLPDDLISYITQDIDNSTGRQRRRISLSLPVGDIDPKCEEVKNEGITFEVIETGINAGNMEAVTDLDAVAIYLVHIMVRNDRGNQTNTTVEYPTGELAPYTEPEMQLEFSSFCVVLNLKPPTQQNGIITYYEYGCWDSGEVQNISRTINASSLMDQENKTEVCGLESASRIKCMAIAVNSIGPSPKAIKEGYTVVAVNSKGAPEVGAIDESAGTVDIKIYPVEPENDNVNITLYLVVISQEESDAPNNRKKRSLPSECSVDELYNSTVAAANNQTCYITAVFEPKQLKTSGLDFTVGSKESNSGYYNQPLEKDTKYTVHVGYKGIIENEKSFTQITDSTSFQVTEELLTTTAKPIAAIVAGTIVPVVAVALVIGAVFLYIKRFRKKPDKNDKEIEFTPLQKANPSPKPMTKPTLKPKPVDRNPVQIYDKVRVTHITKLLDLATTQEESLKEDYKKLGALPKPIMEVASRPENKGKCKYKGLYPGDTNRVVLDTESPDHSDFINASHIQGYTGKNEYIASQGPQKATIDDFWLMIWQQKVKAVVMVTNLVENGHPKCEMYWPMDETSPTSFRDITVSMTSYVMWADFVIRELEVSKDGQIRKIKQFHFTSWPDHDVPNEMSPFITFYRRVHSETFRLTGPLLVHCSAGVGRTGTFLGLDTLMNQAEKNPQVDLFDCIRLMRERRPSMVQTEKQYIFLHKVIYEAYTTSSYVVPANEIESRLSSGQIYSNTESPLADEFEHLQMMIRLHDLDVSEGMSPENQPKNRNQDILPPSKPKTDKGRLLRPKVMNSSEEDYINAVLIDAYRKQTHLIATQAPLPSTVADFWNVICDQKIKVIVHLDSLLKGEEFYPAFDGGETAIDDQNKVVRRVQTTQDNGISFIKLQFSTFYEDCEVMVMSADSWHTVGIPTVTDMLHYLESLEKCQQQTGDNRICIVSSDGGMKCGLMICAYNAVEKMKAEQEVDVYNSALMAKYRRPQFINSMEEYAFLYDVLKSYADQFSDYANFGV